MPRRGRCAGTVFELGAIGRKRQDRLGHQRRIVLAVGFRLVDQTHVLLVIHEGPLGRSLSRQSRRSDSGGMKSQSEKLRAHGSLLFARNRIPSLTSKRPHWPLQGPGCCVVERRGAVIM